MIRNDRGEFVAGCAVQVHSVGATEKKRIEPPELY